MLKDGYKEMSIHNIYPEFSDQVVKRYTKTTVHAIAGKRLDPYHPDQRIDFLLISDERNYNHESRKLAFDYDTDVIELYSEREVRLFATLNKATISAGMLIVHDESAPVVRQENALTDSDIIRILLITNRLVLRKRLTEIDSPITLKRVKELLTPDHKAWYAEEVNNRLTAIDTTYQ
jgi:hypothetical protein